MTAKEKAFDKIFGIICMLIAIGGVYLGIFGFTEIYQKAEQDLKEAKQSYFEAHLKAHPDCEALTAEEASECSIQIMRDFHRKQQKKKIIYRSRALNTVCRRTT